jgi:nucleoside 2-deoxyribosyltransferase
MSGKPLKVYLAGPMDFVSEKEQTGWRNKATELFNIHEIKALDPCRRPHSADLSPREIFNLDLVDIDNSDLILVDCRNMGVPQFGTPCEVFYMNHVLKRPVIGWYDEGREPSKKGIFQQVLIDRKFPSLEEACDHIIGYYND